jgi:hypothetical protein
MQLPVRTALGPVILARVLHPGRVIIAGPSLLRHLRRTLDQLHEYGARLMIIEGAINRTGASAPDITDACILCTGTSAEELLNSLPDAPRAYLPVFLYGKVPVTSLRIYIREVSGLRMLTCAI